LIIEVRPESPIPPYEQIRAQVATMAASGVLPAGHRLPSIRQLAGDLGLAPGTVARAYRELETAGVVVSRVGRGTVIASRVRAMSEAARRRRLADAARSYVDNARRIGASDRETLAMVRELLAAEAAEATGAP
jgi:DNA-binding transcriptional regulator YhcF (GntR family)